MRNVMRENVLKEEKERRLSERKEYGDRLVEKWSKKKNCGEGLVDFYNSGDTSKEKAKNQDRVRGLSMILENQERHLQKLTETQISSAFQTTPENVIRIVRLGYPNSVRGQIFWDWPMATPRDSIYYLSPVYATTKRGATAGDVTHESSSYRYPSEIEEQSIGTGNGVLTNFTGTLSPNPVRPYTIMVVLAGKIVARDDGNGNIVSVGSELTGTNTINYTTGAVDITFAVAPGVGEDVLMVSHFDSEVEGNWPELGQIELQLRDYQFRLKQWPIGFSWSKMTELILDGTLDIDAEEAMLTGASEEMKKALDYHAITLAYRYALRNTLTTFDANYTAAGTYSDREHAQGLKRAIEDASDVPYNQLNRGGINHLIAGPRACNYISSYLEGFSAAGAQPKVGIYKVGEYNGISVYKAPISIVPTDEVLTVFNNDRVEGDSSIVFGTYVPLYQTSVLEFRQLYKEAGLAHYGDYLPIQTLYLGRIKVTNIP